MWTRQRSEDSPEGSAVVDVQVADRNNLITHDKESIGTDDRYIQLRSELDWTKRLICIVLPLSTLLSIIGISTVVVFFLTCSETQNWGKISGKSRMELRDFCLPCDELRKYALDDLLMYQKVTRETPGGKSAHHCCIDHRNTSQLLEMMTGFFKRNINREKDSGTLCLARRPVDKKMSANCTAPGSMNCAIPLPSRGRPAAHLTWNRGRRTSQKSNEIHPLMAWDQDSSVAFRHQLEIREGSLVISEKGRYYIYSQVFFRQDTGSQDVGVQENDNQIISHSMYRYNLDYIPNSGKERLLQHSQTKCWAKYKDFFEHTSFLAGIFNFRRGDEIYVTVSDTSIVHSDAKSTFFGIVKM